MLTPEQVSQFRTSAGLSPTPPTPTQNGANDIIAQRKAALNPSTTPPQVSAYNSAMGKNDTTPGIIPQAFGQMKSGYQQTVEGAKNPNVLEGAQQIGRGTLNEAGGALRAVFSPIEAATKIVSQIPGIHEVVGGVDKTTKAVGDFIGSNKQLQDFMQSNPNAEEVVGNLIGIGSAIGLGKLGTPDSIPATKLGGVVDETLSNVVSKTSDLTTSATEKVKSMVTKTPEETASTRLQNTTNAINPDLSGKKLVNAYKEKVTGNREITPSSIFKEQGLNPSQQAKNLATRLDNAGVSLGKDPVKNLSTLKTALTDTEAKIEKNLDEGDPRFDLGKDSLVSKLEEVKKTIPREFKTIKDSKSIFNNVIDFAKETIDKAEDTIRGGRKARTAFDNQAKAEYPSAYKNGEVDVSTPAGRAIKTARDIINEHIYTVAPAGGELQSLIGKEADIFRATETAAEKAAQNHGETSYQKMKTNNPKIKAGIEMGKKIVPFGIATHL